jgi:hypothetical protein
MEDTVLRTRAGATTIAPCVFASSIVLTSTASELIWCRVCDQCRRRKPACCEALGRYAAAITAGLLVCAHARRSGIMRRRPSDRCVCVTLAALPRDRVAGPCVERRASGRRERARCAPDGHERVQRPR